MIIGLKIKFLLKKLEKMRNRKTVDINKRGMFIEVDLDYPEETHTLHKHVPLAPERYNVTSSELRPINQFLYRKMKNGNQQAIYCEEKLIPIFHKRKRYIPHIKCFCFTYPMD